MATWSAELYGSSKDILQRNTWTMVGLRVNPANRVKRVDLLVQIIQIQIREFVQFVQLLCNWGAIESRIVHSLHRDQRPKSIFHLSIAHTQLCPLQTTKWQQQKVGKCQGMSKVLQIVICTCHMTDWREHEYQQKELFSLQITWLIILISPHKVLRILFGTSQTPQRRTPTPSPTSEDFKRFSGMEISFGDSLNETSP